MRRTREHGKSKHKNQDRGNSMHSISHPPFIKKPSLMQYYTLFATYLGTKKMLFILMNRPDLLHICHLDR